LHKMVAVVALFIMAGCIAGMPQANAQYGNNNNGYYDDYGDYQVFYDELAPYGQWYNDPQYGFVWVPRVGRDFRPYYTNGYWQMTPYGNMWVSGYAWGWAPFHYGRWAMSNMFGWIWIPGSEWGPAWVTWRQGGGYYGWAPMGPGISINISFGNNYYTPDPWWTFIPCNHIHSRNFHTYYSPRRTTTIIHNTTIINNTYVDNRSRTTYITGPSRSQVETATRKPVEVIQVSNRNRAGAAGVSRNQISIYRPEIARGTGRNATPRNVKKLEKSTVDMSRTANAGNRNTNSQRNPSSTTPVRKETQPVNNTRNTNVPQNIRQESLQRKNTEVRKSVDNNRNAKPQVNQRTAPPQQQQGSQRQVTPSRTPVPQQQTTPSRVNSPATPKAPQKVAPPAERKTTRSESSSSNSRTGSSSREEKKPAAPRGR
jgi:hypothetical protein